MKVTYNRLPEKPVERTTIRLPVALVGDLKREARRRGLAADDLASQIIRIVSSEALYDAVLGRPDEPLQQRSARRT